jgi:phage gpG-like protein
MEYIMIDSMFFRLKTSEVAEYNPLRVYRKGEICIFGSRLFMSLTDDNKGDSPILGTNWDQIL